MAMFVQLSVSINLAFLTSSQAALICAHASMMLYPIVDPMRDVMSLQKHVFAMKALLEIRWSVATRLQKIRSTFFWHSIQTFRIIFRNIVTEQAQTWEGVITEGLPAETGVSGTIDPCDGIDGIDPCPCPALPETIDDMYICMAFVQLAPDILGSANFELLREGTRGLPYTGAMRFNSDFPTDDQQFLDTVVRSCAVHSPQWCAWVNIGPSNLFAVSFFFYRCTPQLHEMGHAVINSSVVTPLHHQNSAGFLSLLLPLSNLLFAPTSFPSLAWIWNTLGRL